MIFKSAPVGRVLTLDGTVQLTTLDAHHYNESFVHPAVMTWLASKDNISTLNHYTHNMPSSSHVFGEDLLNILIIGGGDGGLAGEVLRYPDARVTIVEIDACVVEVSRDYLSDTAGGAFHDPRATWVIGDGIDFVKQAQHQGQYDMILVDSSDPIGPAEKLFTPEFYEACKACLKPSGIALHQSGSIYYQREEVISTYRIMQQLYRYPWLLMPQVPTYPGGSITLMGGSDQLSQSLSQATMARLQQFIQAIQLKTRYYSGAMHAAMQVLPHNMENILKESK
jgi:spermidine synthase